MRRSTYFGAREMDFLPATVVARLFEMTEARLEGRVIGPHQPGSLAHVFLERTKGELLIGAD